MRAGVARGRGATAAVVATLLASCGAGRDATGGGSDTRPAEHAPAETPPAPANTAVEPVAAPPQDDAPAIPASDSPGWPKRFKDAVLSIAASGGRVYVLSSEWRPARAVLSAYERSGALLWERRWPLDSCILARHDRALAAAPHAGVYVALDGFLIDRGRYPCPAFDVDGRKVAGALMRIAADGTVLWSREAPAGYGGGTTLAAAPDGRVAALPVFGSFEAVVLDSDGRQTLAPPEANTYGAIGFDGEGALVGVRAWFGGMSVVKTHRDGRTAWEVTTAARGSDVAVAASGSRVAVLRREASGEVVVDLHDGSDGRVVATQRGVPVCCSLALDASGAVILAGHSAAGAAVAKLAPSGALVADRVILPGVSLWYEPRPLAVGADGSILVGGRNTDHPDTSLGGVTLPGFAGFVAALGPSLEAEYGATGPTSPPQLAARWVAVPGVEIATLVPDGEGGAFIASRSFGGGDTLDLRSVSAGGALRWARTFDLAGSGRVVNGLAATPDGGVLVGLHAVCDPFYPWECPSSPDLGGGSFRRHAIVKLGAGGAFEWQIEPSLFSDTRMAVGPDGAIAFAEGGALTVRGADGAVRWRAEAWPLDESNGWREGSITGAPVFDPSGNVYALRSGPAASARGYHVASWSADGRLRWVGPALDGFFQGERRIRLGVAGGTVVATWSRGTATVVAAFARASGDEQWRSSQQDWPVSPGAVLAAPDGGALVVGELLREDCRELGVARIDARGSVVSTRSLTAHGACVGAPRLAAAAIRADGALIFGGVTSLPADVGGTLVPEGTHFLASTAAP